MVDPFSGNGATEEKIDQNEDIEASITERNYKKVQVAIKSFKKRQS